MRAAALKSGGWVLVPTSAADAYRTYTVQLNTFLLRYEPVTQTVYVNTPSERRKMWQAATSLGYPSIYWIKKNIGTPAKPIYPATAATPGTSPHGLGCAIDGAFPGVNKPWTPALPWLTANARRFGFAWSLQSEPWHVQWVEGDRVPQAVLDYEKPLPPPIIVVPDEGDDMAAIAAIYPPGLNLGVSNPKTFLLRGDGGIRHAQGPDVDYANALNAKTPGTVPSFPVVSEEHYRALETQSAQP